MNDPAGLRSVAIIGGGLAGLAAATTLVDSGRRVELFEARRSLGGRAGSFLDPDSGEAVDHCQHVALGCCTEWLEFCRRTGIDGLLRRDRAFWFLGPRGTRHRLAAATWLPPPLHLAPAFMRLSFLSFGERIAVAKALARLRRQPTDDDPAAPTIDDWLRSQGQSARAVDWFWSLVLKSALGESVRRTSVAAARKVFVDAFLGERRGHEIIVPAVPLAELYDRQVADWLRRRAVAIHLGAEVCRIDGNRAGVSAVVLAGGERRSFDDYILAVPWRRLRGLLGPGLQSALAETVAAAARIESAPITAVHLWFDRPIMHLPHVALAGRLSQWVFRRDARDSGQESERPRHYYQVVISASRELEGRDRRRILAEVMADLIGAFPQARQARLLAGRVVTQREAVFSPSPGLDRLRPPQQTAVRNLKLAGDWTATGWPATMEGAVRSGHLAARAVLDDR